MKSRSGFTIVELLIVIVVIGILAALVISTFSQAQVRARNAAKHNELKAWHKIFEVYKAQKGYYPDLTNGGYCLGADFPLGGGGVARCRDYGGTGTSSYPQSASAGLMSELASVASLPTSSKHPVRGTVGPYTDYTSAIINLVMVIEGQSSDCPDGTLYAWDDGAGRLLCKITLTR